MKGKYLITTDNWFQAPDGNSYNAVWGDVKICSDELLGVKTNTKSTNWYAKVGSEDKHVIIAGCQIHYACKCENKPYTGEINDYSIESGKKVEYTIPTKIYIAE